MICKLNCPEKAARLFEGWPETMIWSCLQGVMGGVYGDSQEHPASAMALLGDFCFLTGAPDEELVRYQPEGDRREFTIMVPQDGRWAELVEKCGPGSVKKITRYALKKEPDVFDRKVLKAAAEGLPEGYTLQRIDASLFEYCRETAWCRDLVSQYRDYESFQKRGLGVMALKGGEPVSGASSYSSYLGGIEIEVDTREDLRRRGLACGCAARLILECLNRGWYPSWDAHNKASLALAEKLGYHFDHAYTAFEVVRENSGKAYCFRPAGQSEIPELFALYKKRTAWMDQAGIRQWNVTEYLEAYPITYYQEQQKLGNLYVLEKRRDKRIVGGVVLLHGDERWSDGAEQQAFYIHNLVTDCGEKGAGKRMLAEVEKLAAEQGKCFLRLDCAVDNAFLNGYYGELGYEPAGTIREGLYAGNLREKKLAADS